MYLLLHQFLLIIYLIITLFKLWLLYTDDIFMLEFGVYFKRTITSNSYFTITAPDTTSVLQLILSVNQNTELYVSDLIQPSAAYYCSHAETNSTANLLLNSSQLHRNEGDIYIAVEVMRATEISLILSMIKLNEGQKPSIALHVLSQ